MKIVTILIIVTIFILEYIMLSITPIYLTIAILIYSILTFTVIGNMRSQKVSIGDGEHLELTRRIRSHGNFAEYVPLAMIALGTAEVTGVSPPILHFCGAALILDRCLHAFYFFGFTKHNEDSCCRNDVHFSCDVGGIWNGVVARPQ